MAAVLGVVAVSMTVGGCHQEADSTGAYAGCDPTPSLRDTLARFQFEVPDAVQDVRYCTYGSVDSWQTYFDFRARRTEVNAFRGRLDLVDRSFIDYNYEQWAPPDHDEQWKLEPGGRYKEAESSRKGEHCRINASVVVEGMTTAEPRVYVAADCFS